MWFGGMNLLSLNGAYILSETEKPFRQELKHL